MKNKEKKWSVYIHTVPKELSGYTHDKYYVGITSNIKERWRRNGIGYKHLSSTGCYPYFWYAIQKYGWDNIKHAILHEGLSLSEACDKEKYYIKLYHSNNKEFGYNQTDGGEGSCGAKITKKQRDARSKNMSRIVNDSEIAARRLEHFRQTSRTPEYRERCSKTAKQLWLDDEFRKKCTGDKCHFSRDKYVFRGGDSPNAKKVVCLNTSEIFETVLSAKDKYRNAHNITRCCNGKLLSSGKINGERLTWAFYDDYISLTQSEIQEKIKKANAKHPCNEMKVINLQTKIVYESQVQASELCRVSNACISYDCSQRKKNWMKYQEYYSLYGDNDVVFYEVNAYG